MPLLVIVGVLLIVSLFDAIRRPTIRRLAVRNLTRRRSEAALVILGSLLGTAIITAAFIVGDTLGASVRDRARTDLGPVDEVVRAVGLDANNGLITALTTPAIPGVDGLLKITQSTVSTATAGSDPRAEPYSAINEVNFDDARKFGGNVGDTGLKNGGATPTGNEVVINQGLAKKLKVKAGATIQIYGYGHAREMKVRQILPVDGLAGVANLRSGFGGSSRALFAPIGTIASLIGSSGTLPIVGEPPASEVLVSNMGGVYDGAQLTDAVTRRLHERVAASGVEIITAKQDLLDNADDAAAQFTQLFGGIGSFSVIAGILLLVNIFVMLADERKSELGMLRAIGLKRNQLVRAFGMEGAVYSIIAAVAGVIAGIGVGRVVAYVAAGIFKSGFGGGLSLRFSLEPQSVITGFLIGATISLVTVWGTSFRLGRLNVIRAIRDIPEAPATRTARLRSYVLSTLGILVGLLLFSGGAKNNTWFGVLAGVPIAAVSAITLLRAVLPRRLAVFLGCGTSLVWGIVSFTLFPDATKGSDIGAFVVQGVILVASATAILATNADAATWGVSKLGVSKRTLAARLGFAYPLARVFRTSMLLGMYSIVIFTLTFLSVFSALFGGQAPKFARETAAGYNVLVDSNFANPVPDQVLLDQPGVAAQATLDRSFPEWTTPAQPEKQRWELTGYDDALLARGTPALSDRLTRFKSDKAAWQAVMHDPALAIVSNFFLQQGGPPSGGLDVGSKITAYDALSGHKMVLTIAAKVESDFTFNGPMVGKDAQRGFTPDATPSRHYVAVKPGANAEEVAARLEGKLITYGVQADTFEHQISDALSTQRGFFSLMQGYLGLGLIIGIAGLGVVMVRAVRERRRQIGMLRAMGFSSRIVRQAFLVEATFLAVQGIVMGTVLALITSYSLLTNSSTFGGGNDVQFVIPWTNIVAVSIVALVGSLAASTLPASQASRIKPAVALRIAD